MTHHADLRSTAAGYAALSICESLLLALSEQKVLRDTDVRGLLEDAAASHHGATDDPAHKEAAALIEQLLAHRNSSLRP